MERQAFRRIALTMIVALLHENPIAGVSMEVSVFRYGSRHAKFGPIIFKVDEHVSVCGNSLH